jgi:sortase (surface protein transpeptidase)
MPKLLSVRLFLLLALILGTVPVGSGLWKRVETPTYGLRRAPETPTAGIVDGLVQAIQLTGEQLFNVWEQVNPAPPEPEPKEEQYVIGRPDGGITPESGSRLMIAKIGVSAPISVKGVSANGVMQDPNGAWDVAWYNFSAGPGAGNAVFAGHVDYAGVGPAVFWGLSALGDGDTIVFRGGGAEIVYRVAWNRLYAGGAAPIAEIVGQNGQDAITLITCGGAWNAAARDYSHRRVVRAIRVS